MTERVIDGSFRPQVRTDLLSTELDGETVVFDAPSDTVLKMNPSATTVWSCCDGGATVDEIATDIAEVFGVERSVVFTQVVELVRQWSDKGLLVGSDGTDASA